MRRFLLLLLSALLAACSGAETDENTSTAVLQFSAIPDNDENLLKQKFDPIAEYLSKELGVTVKYVPVKTYSDAVDLFKNGDIQLAWFGGLTGVQARNAVKGARAIAQGEEDPNYFSYFIANPASGIKKGDTFPTGIAGKKFAFGSQQSTSGRLMPEHFIRQNTGKAPDEYLASISFSGSHDKTAKQVEAGTVDCGALSYKTYDSMVAKGTLDPGKAQVIWKTPAYADYNFTAHPDLETTFGEGFTEKVQTALLNMKDKNLLSAFPRKSLIKAKNSDFDSIEKTARKLEFVR